MEWIEPMEPILTETIKSGDRWIHQVKWDGIRGLCYVDNGRVSLFTRTGRDRTGWYPEVSEVEKLLTCKDAVLDGELIVLGDSGKPSFYNIMKRERIRKKNVFQRYRELYPVHYMIFDILLINGRDLRQVPLADRKQILNKTLKSDGMIHVVEDYTDGNALFSAVKDNGMEGIVSKCIDSRYIGGKKHREWFKTKVKKQILAIVCGVKVSSSEIKSLVLGVYEENRLKIIGSVSSGLSYGDKQLLAAQLSRLALSNPPVPNGKSYNDVIWINPVLTVIVQYLEREPQGGLRHPVLIGFSSRSPADADGKEETV
ncbi:MAG TPA: ATP-dependent DNA ligase [Ruminiclostridium sp.]|jgi:bifunctional non-homologous end joining protein LigD|nr:ATP-dependent DNA ligase [Clostridiaceae bacterium]HAA24853.1 ATP-dependent DNA ligase [Ruminiclostridium sp.]